MYLFLAMLAFTDLGVSVSTLPTVLGIFLFGASEIYFEACLLQIFSVHSFSIMESGVLLLMSVDCLVTIYNPLRYTTILTHTHIVGTVPTEECDAHVPTTLSCEASAPLWPQCPLPPILSSLRPIAFWGSALLLPLLVLTNCSS